MRTTILLAVGLFACSKFGEGTSNDPPAGDPPAPVPDRDGGGDGDAATPSAGALQLQSADIVLTRGAEVTVHEIQLLRSGARGPITVRLEDAPAGVTADALVVDTDGPARLRLHAPESTAFVRGARVRLLASTTDAQVTTSVALTVRGAPGTIDTSYGSSGGVADMPGLVPDSLQGTARFLVRADSTWFVHGSSVRQQQPAGNELRRGVIALTATGKIAVDHFGGGGFALSIPGVNQWVDARPFVQEGKLHFTGSDRSYIYGETLSFPGGARPPPTQQSGPTSLELVRDTTYAWSYGVDLARYTWDGTRADPWPTPRAFPVAAEEGVGSQSGLGIASNFVAQAAYVVLPDGSNVTRVWVSPHDSDAHQFDLPATAWTEPILTSHADSRNRLMLLLRTMGQTCLWHIEKEAPPTSIGVCLPGNFEKPMALPGDRIAMAEPRTDGTALHVFEADGTRTPTWPSAGVHLDVAFADIVDDGEGGLLVLASGDYPWRVQRIFH